MIFPARSIFLAFPLLVLIGAGGSAWSQDATPETEEAGTGADARPTVLVVVGAEGAEEYGEKFREAAATWEKAASLAEAKFDSIGVTSSRSDDREQLEKKIAELAADKDGGPVWLVLIGHGTFDGRTAKFNVRGPDFTEAELAEWLKNFDRPLAVINTASASGPFLSALSGEGRVVITATKSAFEVFYARFGEYFAQAIVGLEAADVDNDDQVSLLEAFLYSADQVAQFYEKQGRLATEHALIDDTGDGFGTRPDWFEGVRATQVAKDGAKPDGERAHQWVLVPNAFERRLSPAQKTRRDDLERKLKDLVRRRSEIGEDAYYEQVEPVLLEIARIYDSVKLPEEETEKPADKAEAPRAEDSNPESVPAPAGKEAKPDGKSS